MRAMFVTFIKMAKKSGINVCFPSNISPFSKGSWEENVKSLFFINGKAFFIISKGEGGGGVGYQLAENSAK